MAAPGTVILFSRNKDDLRINDITGATVKLALIASTWTPDATITGNQVFADMSANEIAAGNGYTAGGFTLTGLTATGITGGYKFSSGNASWTASGGTIPAWRYGLIYVSGALWSLTNPVIGYFLGDSAPADVAATASGNTLQINCPSGGWFDAT